MSPTPARKPRRKASGTAETAAPKPRRGPGRPKDEEKRQAILSAAFHQFLEKGYAAASLEAVAAAAGVSKMTVYGHFQDKATLFGAVVAKGCGTVTATLAELPDPPADLRRALTTYGCSFVAFLRKPEVLQIDRLLAVEAPQHPELAKAFYDSGPRVVQAALIDLLERAQAQGRVGIDDIPAAADLLLAGWCHGPQWMAQRLGLRGPPREAEIRDRVARGVDWFLKAYATDREGAAKP